MSERKVLTKYYPPDFDPSKITRTKGPKNAGPKTQVVRLMAPFSMKCTSCGEYVYKGRKFNSRKETTDEKYVSRHANCSRWNYSNDSKYNIAIYRFYIRCTRCSSEITFKTDPKNMDYTCERGAKRNFEPWREAKLAEETEEERLDRLEREEAEHDAMKELEAKTVDAKQEMAIADALDEIRTRNARLERADKNGEVTVVKDNLDGQRELQEQEDAEAARRAFQGRYDDMVSTMIVDEEMGESSDSNTAASSNGTSTVTAPMAEMPPPTFKRQVKKKKDFSAALGIKKKPALV